jgi:hypothetical protein
MRLLDILLNPIIGIYILLLAHKSYTWQLCFFGLSEVSPSKNTNLSHSTLLILVFKKA